MIDKSLVLLLMFPLQKDLDLALAEFLMFAGVNQVFAKYDEALEKARNAEEDPDVSP